MATLVPGSANLPLARAVAGRFDCHVADVEHIRFPDGEAAVVVDPAVRADDVYVVQSLGPPGDAHLMELALLVDACHRADCARVTVVVPYLGYARQDRRTRPGEAVGARVVANLLESVGADRVLVVDPHTAGLEAMFSIPVDSVSAVNLLSHGLKEELPAAAVVVAPDLGAAKLADRYAIHLDLPTALVSKTRLDGSRVQANRVIGDVRDRAPVIVDDMISTGATIEAAVRALREAGCADSVSVASTHGLFVEDAMAVLAALSPRSIDVTDTLPVDSEQSGLRVRSVAPLLAAAIDRLAAEQPLGDLASHG